MGEWSHFATLATRVGKKFGARWGDLQVTIAAVGWKNGSRFVMGTLSDGTVVLGEPCDFSLPRKRGVDGGHVTSSENDHTGKPKSARSGA